MAVASGVRPYGYERDVFTLQEGEKIGFSGVLFEEPMFVLTAERAMYLAISEANRKFTKYINKGAGISADFEPRADGGNLDGDYDNPSLSGVEDGPGCINFRDYIVDLRTALSGLLMNYITEDIDYSGQLAVEDYFHANSFPGPDGLGRTWVHPDNNEEPSGLAVSGSLYDIDLREVQYQPYARASKFYDSSGIAPRFVMPIIPAFCSTNGSMVNVQTRDVNHAKNLIISEQFPGILGSGYQAADSGRFLVMGDGFVVTDSQLRIGYDLLDQGATDSTAAGACQVVAGRSLLEPMGGNGLGEFSAPALTLTSGIYAFHVYDATKSGVLGIWPPMEAWGNEGFDGRGVKYVGDTPHKASGIHVFDYGIWTANASGVELQSPHNGASLWQRFADQESYQTAQMTSARRWSDDTPSHDPGIGNNTLHVLHIKSQVDVLPIYDEWFIIATYDKRTGDLLSSTENGSFQTADPSIPIFTCGDVSDHSPHEGGISIAGYTYMNTRESSDSFLRALISDGTNIRGGITPSGFGTAVGSPEPVGTIGGTLVGSSSVSPLTNPYRMYGLVVEQTREVYPLPASSGKSQAGSFHGDSNGTYEIMMEQELGHEFEPLTVSNFSPTNNWRIIKDQTKDYMVFNAKKKGKTAQHTFLGAVEIVSSGGTEIIRINEMRGPFDSTPHWIDDFTS